MVVLECPVEICNFRTHDLDVAAAVALLTIHGYGHAPGRDQGVVDRATQGSVQRKAPPLIRPMVEQGISEEKWEGFLIKWDMFKSGSGIVAGSANAPLFDCCESQLGEDLLKYKADIIKATQ